MSKEILRIKQIDEGGENPKTKLPEKPLWELTFDDSSVRILGKPKMEEYISKSYDNTVHHFRRHITILKDDRRVILWSVVFCDYQSVLLSGSELCNKIMLGHQRKDEEEYKELEESLAKKNLPLNHFLFSDSEEQYPFLKKERYELDELRKKSLKNLNEEEDKINLEGNY
jgi:hypothetical protein|tara:strand:+ start:35 stop:544 length:510 start_codon:yes stop_codon:yes gene_type:complete